MKKLKLFFAACALIMGAGQTWAQTDVTSTYLVNPSFETLKASDGTTDVTVKTKLTNGLYGWSIDNSSMGDYQIESQASGSVTGFPVSGDSRYIVPSDGTYYYFNRKGWGNLSTTLSTTTKTAVAEGLYYLEFDYKAADYSNNNNAGNNGTTMGITVTDASSNVLATIPAAKRAYSITNGGSNPGTDSYMNTAPWTKMGIAFQVTSASALTFSIQQNMVNSGRSDIIYDNFKLYKIEKDDANVNFTGYIVNYGFDAVNENGWTATTTFTNWGANALSDGNKQQWNGNFSFSQELANLPSGKYKLSVQGFYRPGNNGAELTAQNALLFAGNDNSQPLKYVSSEAKAEKDDANGFTATYGELGYVPNSQADAKKAFESGAYNNELIFSLGDNTVTIGTKKETLIGNDWTVFDNFQLFLVSPAIQYFAEAFPAGGSLTADKWYYYDVAIANDYKFTTADLTKVVFTQDGTQNVEDAATAVTNPTAVQALSAGKVYVKASEDLVLTIAPNTYSYSVGDGTPSVADGKYTQSKTLTVTFEAATTDDPDGALSILDASKITVNGSATTSSLEGKVLTVTLADALTTSTDYAVSIAAGAVGYNADNANTAISLTAKTPAVFDGTYFIATTDGTQYISRGGDSNTEAVLDKYGIAVNFTTDVENVTHIQFVDNDKNLFGGSNSIYTDKNESDLGDNAARARWTVAAVDGGYSLYSGTWSKYIAAGTGQESKVTAATYADEAYAWTLEAPSAHPAKMAAYKDANAATVATTAGLTGTTTIEALKTVLENNFTSEAVTLTNAYSSVAEKYQPNGYGEKIIEQSYTGLKNGIYKVSLSVFHRIRDYASTYNYHQNGADNPTSYLYANDEKMQIASPLSESNDEAYSAQDAEYGGKHYPNGTTAAGEAFTAGKYKLEVYTVVTDGTLKIGLKDPGKYSNANWICFRDLAITAYVFNGDYSALETAISTAEGNLGFEDGEYAPYNNVASMGKLATAKALYASKDGINQGAIDAVTGDLTGAVWTENVGEVNAFSNGGNFISGNLNGLGWKNSAWVGEESNYVAVPNGTSITYGELEGFEMPLKANTVYELKLRHSGWDGSNTDGGGTVSVLLGEDGLVATTYTGNSSNAKGDDSKYKDESFLFKTGAAGNYVFKLTGRGGRTTVKGFSILRVPNQSVTVSAAGYATYASDYPLDFTGIEGLTAYKATVSGTTATFTSVTTVPAGEGVLLKGAGTFSVPVTTGVAAWADDDNAFVRGTGEAVATEDGSFKNYVLSTDDEGNNVGFYYANDETVPTNRAYLQSTAATTRLTMVFEDEVTGISTVSSNVQNNVIYNMNGVRVTKPAKGLYIKNGKKLFVK